MDDEIKIEGIAVDRVSREKIARALAGYIQGHLDSWELDQELCPLDTSDEVCLLLAREMWYLYSDTVRHRNSGVKALTPDYENMVYRWIALLKTDLLLKNLHLDKALAEHEKPVSFLRRVYWCLCLDSFCNRPRFKNNIFWPLRDSDAWRSVS